MVGQMIRWQDWTNVALGIWLVVSPYQLAYTLNAPATENAMGVGAMLALFNVMTACRLVDAGQEIFNIVIGAWLLLSPFALGIAAMQAAGMNAMIVGACVLLLAFWQLHDALGARKG